MDMFLDIVTVLFLEQVQLIKLCTISNLSFFKTQTELVKMPNFPAKLGKFA